MLFRHSRTSPPASDPLVRRYRFKRLWFTSPVNACKGVFRPCQGPIRLLGWVACGSAHLKLAMNATWPEVRAARATLTAWGPLSMRLLPCGKGGSPVQLSGSTLLLLSYLESIEITKCMSPDGCDVKQLVSQGFVSSSATGCTLTADGHARLNNLRAAQRAC